MSNDSLLAFWACQNDSKKASLTLAFSKTFTSSSFQLFSTASKWRYCLKADSALGYTACQGGSAAILLQLVYKEKSEATYYCPCYINRQPTVKLGTNEKCSSWCWVNIIDPILMHCHDLTMAGMAYDMETFISSRGLIVIWKSPWCTTWNIGTPPDTLVCSHTINLPTIAFPQFNHHHQCICINWSLFMSHNNYLRQTM